MNAHHPLSISRVNPSHNLGRDFKEEGFGKARELIPREFGSVQHVSAENFGQVSHVQVEDSGKILQGEADPEEEGAWDVAEDTRTTAPFLSVISVKICGIHRLDEIAEH